MSQSHSQIKLTTYNVQTIAAQLYNFVFFGNITLLHTPYVQNFCSYEEPLLPPSLSESVDRALLDERLYHPYHMYLAVLTAQLGGLAMPGGCALLKGPTPRGGGERGGGAGGYPWQVSTVLCHICHRCLPPPPLEAKCPFRLALRLMFAHT